MPKVDRNSGVGTKDQIQYKYYLIQSEVEYPNPIEKSKNSIRFLKLHSLLHNLLKSVVDFTF